VSLLARLRGLVIACVAIVLALMVCVIAFLLPWLVVEEEGSRHLGEAFIWTGVIAISAWYGIRAFKRGRRLPFAAYAVAPMVMVILSVVAMVVMNV
jgi:hypothetical protein